MFASFSVAECSVWGAASVESSGGSKPKGGKRRCATDYAGGRRRKYYAAGIIQLNDTLICSSVKNK